MASHLLVAIVRVTMGDLWLAGSFFPPFGGRVNPSRTMQD
jgi:hypothetical protein